MTKVYLLIILFVGVTLGLDFLSTAKTEGEKSENFDHDGVVAATAAYRVAFIFAGSVRSFQYPIIHETMRWNLVNSFCPRHLKCVPDVIARVSMTDNIHKGFNASGEMLTVATGADSTDRYRSLKKMTQHALSRLLLKGESKDHLVIDWTDIGSEKERLEMESVFPSTSHARHKLFRLLDSRRYSMYFNRYMAYKLAMKHEKAYNMGSSKGEGNGGYDWIVHARLDGAWGEPIQDLNKWSKNKVYVPNSWASEIPDTFALLPRKYADDYYSMEKLLVRGVFCLGGGNFDPNTLKPNYMLNTLHFTLPEVIEAKKDDCNALFKEGDTWNEDKTTGIKWAEDGISEQILKRKLKNVGISLDLNTLAYHPFFTVTVRYQNVVDICIYLHHNFMIGWARSTQYYPLGIFLGCNVMMNDLRKLHTNSYIGCELNGNKYVGEHCLLSSKISKFNFMPFVVLQHPSPNEKRCMSGNIGENEHTEGRIEMSHCIDTQSFGEMQALFHSTQMLFFYPHMRLPQEIKVIDTSVNPKMICLTVQPDSFTIVLSKCLEGKGTKTQLFTVNMIKTIDSRSSRKVNYVQFGWRDNKDGDSTNFCMVTPIGNNGKKSARLELETCKIVEGSSSRIINKHGNEGISFMLRKSIIHPYADRSMFQIERVNSTSYRRTYQINI